MNYEALKAGQELDTLVAEKVMGESRPEYFPEQALESQLSGNPIKSELGNWLLLCDYEEGDIPTWHPIAFSTNIAAAFLMEEYIKQQGLSERYAYNLVEIVIPGSAFGFLNRGAYEKDIFAITHALPEHRCIAALKAAEARHA
jgi:hypothetical protein